MNERRRENIFREIERDFSIKLKNCPWCKKSPKYFPEYYEDSSRAFRAIGCRNEECRVKPITGDYSNDTIRREAWNTRDYMITRDPKVNKTLRVRVGTLQEKAINAAKEQL